MKCQKKFNISIKMPLISIILILINIKNATSINYNDNDNGYTSTNHLRHYLNNHPDYKSYRHHPIGTHLDSSTSHKRRIHHNRHEQEQDQHQNHHQSHHQHQHHQQHQPLHHHQHPYRLMPQITHHHNINKDDIETPWKVPLPIVDDAHSLIDDRNDHHNHHKHHNRLYSRYDNRRIENAVNAYKMSKSLRTKENNHKNSHNEQSTEMNRADSMAIAKGHFNNSSHQNELQLNEDSKNLISGTLTLTSKSKHIKAEKKKKTKTKTIKKKTPEEEDYYYYYEQENDDEVDNNNNDDDNDDNDYNDDDNNDDKDDDQDSNDDENNDDDDDDDDVDDDNFIVDPKDYDYNENDDNNDDDDEFLAASVVSERKYTKGKSTRAVGVPVHNLNDYIDDEPYKNDDHKLAAYENPVKKPVGVMTAEKWQNYGSEVAVEKSKRRFNSQNSLGQRLASAHYERIKKEGACRIPRPKIIMKPSEATKRYRPSWTILHRCSDTTGCCDYETKTCAAVNRSNVDLAFFVSYVGGETVEIHTYENHTECACVDRYSSRSQYNTIRDNDDNENNDATEHVVAIDGIMINRTCQCPKYFNVETIDDNIIADKRNSNSSSTDNRRNERKINVVGSFKANNCQCNCNGSSSRCYRLKRGEEEFSLEDKRCIQTRQCTKPQCQSGNYMNGRCPRTHVRRRNSGHHRR